MNMAKRLINVVLAIAIMLSTSSPIAFAAPFKAKYNPQIVANYNSGDHGIPGEPFLHQGADVVMLAGKSWNVQQWFYGYSEENGGIIEGDHSVWKLSKNGQCPTDTTAVTVSTDPASSNYWGNYLKDGTTYCVRTNDLRQQR